MSKDNGGPAFPDVCYTYKGDVGVSLRDYFAAKAMQGLLEDSAPGRFKYDATALARVAEIAYQFSDAMLAERAKASQAES